MNLLSRKNWNEDERAYIVRLDDDTRHVAFWCTLCRPVWVVAEWDNEGNQIGDADFYANKRCFPDWVLNKTEADKKEF